LIEDNKVYGGGVNHGSPQGKGLLEITVGIERISHVVCSYSHALIYTAKRELYTTAPNLKTTRKLKFMTENSLKMLISDISEHDIAITEDDKLYIRLDSRGEFDTELKTPPLDVNETIALAATGYCHTIVITGPRKKKHSRLHANWKFDDIDFYLN
jgi:hypothetical protein